ncbi:MAG: hypothetical protein UHN47_07000 [Lachnospiraceae bacterium]|nr:hypothetical protein [Lachnospiraceae bacterium]
MQFESTDFAVAQPVLDGMVSYIHEKLNLLINGILTWLTYDFHATSDYFYEQIGLSTSEGNYTNAMINAETFDVFYWIAIILSLFVFIFCIIMLQMGPIIEQKNETKELIIRFIISLILTVAMKPFLDILNNICDELIVRVIATLSHHDFKEKKFSVLDAMANMDNMVLGILSIIVMIGIIIEFVKTLLDIMERYLMIQLLLVASPVPSGLFVSRGTSAIYRNFIVMYISQLFLLLMNRYFLSLFAIMCINGTTKTLVGCLFLMAFLKSAQKLDAYLKAMGLSVAQTGGSLLYSALAGAMFLGGLVRGATGGMTSFGNALETIGANTGNYAAANMGTSLKSMAKLQPSSPANSLAAFTKNNGLKGNTSDLLKAHSTKAFSEGNAKAISNMPIPYQTDAIKGALLQNGADSFMAATGISANNITQAQISPMDGSITGQYKFMNENGQESVVGFKASTSVTPNSIGNLDFGDGVSRNIAITPTNGAVYNGQSFHCNYASLNNEQLSPASAVTGVAIDNNLYGNLGVTNDTVEGNILVSRDSADNVMAAINMETGASYHMGITSTIENTSDSPSISEQEIFSDTRFSRYMPTGSIVEPGTYGVDANTGNIYAEWKNGSTVGAIRISRPEITDIATNSKTNIVNLGPDRGCYTVRSYKKKQSNETVKEFHS